MGSGVFEEIGDLGRSKMKGIPEGLVLGRTG